jgi:hypothetical protein
MAPLEFHPRSQRLSQRILTHYPPPPQLFRLFQKRSLLLQWSLLHRR